MLRTLMTTAAATLVLTAATTAGAQDAKGFGQKGSFIVSADRLVPLFAYNHTKVGDSSANTTTFSLLPNFNDNAFNGTFFNVPRVGFDYAVIDRLTIGGSIGVAFQAGSSVTTPVNNTPGSPTVTNDGQKGTYFVFNPRVGYALPLSDLFAFWPRLGLSFNMLHTGFPDQPNGRGGVDTRSDSTTLWGLSLEPLFVITPVQHFGFFVGPVLDIPLTGSTGQTRNGVTVSEDYSSLHFGVTAGLLGWF